jgi:hypothetical protein
MTVSHGEYVKRTTEHVRIFVLGHLGHTGTAVLVDTEQPQVNQRRSICFC